MTVGADVAINPFLIGFPRQVSYPRRVLQRFHRINYGWDTLRELSASPMMAIIQPSTSLIVPRDGGEGSRRVARGGRGINAPGQAHWSRSDHSIKEGRNK